MTDQKKMQQDLVLSAVLTLILFYLSTGHGLLNLPFPGVLRSNPVLLYIIQMLLSLSVIFINRHLLAGGFASLFHLSPNMDCLVVLGASAAFIYSTVISLLNIIFYKNSGEYTGENELYFESCALILTIVAAGKVLEKAAMGRTSNALQDLSDMSPKTALLLVDGREVETAIDDVKTGDIFVLKPGMSVPVDGIIESGTSAVNESSLTGESMPVDKEPGMSVSASTINLTGFLTCRATNVGSDTAFSRIVQMVSDSSSGEAPISRHADKISCYFIFVVIVLSVITFVFWHISGFEIGFSLSRAISVLIVSCPCALSLAAPVSIMAGTTVGSRHGILYKTAQSIESAGKTEIVVVDKTGTLTTGEPKVTDIISTEGDIEHRDLLLSIAYALESKSEHPVAKAICSFASSRFVPVMETTNFESIPGKGIRADLVLAGSNHTVYAGNESFIAESLLGDNNAKFNNEFSSAVNSFLAEGKTPTLFASDSGMLGVIAVSDDIKDESYAAVHALRNEGIHVCMVTGDNLAASESVGSQLGIEADDVISEVMPDEKAAIVQKLKETGRVAMIGDGVNDAPALTVADTGIAIGAGTDVAIDAADVVLIRDSLVAAVDSVRLSKETLRIIHQNLVWAISYNIIGIPLAAGCFYRAFGWLLNPMFCAAAMSISSIFVITNALRLFSFTTTKISVRESTDDENML